MKRRIFLTITILAASTSCKNTGVSSSSIKLAGGKWDAFNQMPFVYGIGRGQPSGTGFESPFCTATAISDSLLITAAHCFVNDATTPVWVISGDKMQSLSDSSGQIITGNPVVNPDFGKLPHFNVASDLAVIKFPPGTFPQVATLSPTAAKAGDQVTLVGYGVDQSGGAVVGRQIGTNQIMAILDANTVAPADAVIIPTNYGMIWLQHQAANGAVGIQEAGTVPGDSGGPLFTSTGLVGVLDGGGFTTAFEKSKGETNSIYSNLSSPKNYNFLSTFVTTLSSGVGSHASQGTATSLGPDTNDSAQVVSP